MFIGRQKEIKTLSDRYQSIKKEFVAITGKRGVGKTELMLKSEALLSEVDIMFKLIGKKGASLKKQLSIADRTFERVFGKEIHSRDWEEFFYSFTEIAKEKDCKIFLFIDEFPWLNVKGSGFVDEFGAFWNHYNKNNLKVIITGSAVSWMAKNVFRNAGGLYHKVTCHITLKPFNLLETAEYLLKINRNFTNNELVDYYMATGGVVRYLGNVNIADSFLENKRNIYDNNYFVEFFDNSFASNQGAHEKIVRLFSNRIKLSFSEIKEVLKEISLPTLNKSLNELVETDILVEIKNYRSAEKLYVLSDLFFFNYLRKDNPSNRGLAFEILLLNNIGLFLNESRKFTISKWNGKHAQIDLILEFESKDFLLIECKYSQQVYQLEYEEKAKIENRIAAFKEENNKKRSFVNVMLATMNGVKNRTDLSFIDFSVDRFLTEKMINYR